MLLPTRHEEAQAEKGQTLILQGSAWFRGAKLHGPTVKKGPDPGDQEAILHTVKQSISMQDGPFPLKQSLAKLVQQKVSDIKQDGYSVLRREYEVKYSVEIKEKGKNGAIPIWAFFLLRSSLLLSPSHHSHSHFTLLCWPWPKVVCFGVCVCVWINSTHIYSHPLSLFVFLSPSVKPHDLAAAPQPPSPSWLNLAYNLSTRLDSTQNSVIASRH